MRKLFSIIRLSKVALVNLFEKNARLAFRYRNLSEVAGTIDVKGAWHRRYVVVRGETEWVDATLAFEHRAPVSVGSKFNLRLVRPDSHSGLSITIAEETIQFPAPGRLKTLGSILTATPKAFVSIVQARADIYTFLRTGDAATAARLRTAFDITPPADKSCVLPDNFLSQVPLSAPPGDTATVVVPVYNAADDLALLLEQLNAVSVPIIFVNDASDDTRITPMLARFAKKHAQASVINKPHNEGFVAAVNLGLSFAKGHVILLNTDTLPPQGWVERLLGPINRDRTIASVTPVSNNAEIISVPAPGCCADVTPDMVEKINQTAQRFGAQYQAVEVPTGVGFCIAMNRRFLDMFPRLDHAFGRGYGEEVDWCRKVMKAGGRHVALTSLFVGHKGSASFGDAKSSRLKKSSAIIKSRYPAFEPEVQAWVHAAPMQPQKLALSVAWLAAVSNDPVPIFVAHSMGGGAETALQESIKQRLQAGTPGMIVVRVGGPARWRLELITKENSQSGDAMDEQIIEALLAPISRRHLIYSCGVGARHPLDAPTMLTRLTTEKTFLDLHIHDFFPISPSWNLLDSAGTFQGVPSINTTDPAHGVPALNGHPSVSHEKWRAVWGRIFSRANSVTAFSETSRALVTQAYKQAAGKVLVHPHVLRNLPKTLRSGGHTIGILGSLNRPKGAEVALRLAKVNNCSRRIVVIGEMDGTYTLPRPHVVHGRFTHDQITALAQNYDVGLWLIPSICPETFSFATHEALATGLPVLAFDRGAQGEAVDAAENGHVIGADPSDTSAILKMIEAVLATHSPSRASHHIPPATPTIQPLH